MVPKKPIYLGEKKGGVKKVKQKGIGKKYKCNGWPAATFASPHLFSLSLAGEFST